MSDSSSRYYLDCPISEENDAMSLGALWDADLLQCFVPPAAYPTISQFNRWAPLGRFYLNCPFKEKDAAKQAGAIWDPKCKAWYVDSCANKSELQKVAKWLPAHDARNTIVSKTKPIKGNASDATKLRISNNMTVPQLQEECKLRGIKGFSSKNKEELLDQLQVGSIWQTMSLNSAARNKLTTSASKRATAAKATTKERKPKVTKKAQVVRVKLPIPQTTPTREKISSIAKTAICSNKAKQAGATLAKVVDCSSLPRVTMNLTKAQMMHELLNRQPETKGTANKAKAWFIEQLGEESIWATAPGVNTQDLYYLPKVSPSLTVDQLKHELMSRATGKPNLTKGLSTTTKPALLKLLGEGSIWSTGVSQATEQSRKSANNRSTKKSGPQKQAPSFDFSNFKVNGKSKTYCNVKTPRIYWS